MFGSTRVSVFAIALLFWNIEGIAGDIILSSSEPAVLVMAASQQYNYTPGLGSEERKQIMNAAREPVSRDIGQRVIFVVDVLQSDGKMAYLQGVPHQSNGEPLDWTKTHFREHWMKDAMSDVVMVLLSKRGEQWIVLDYVIGPTDVYWYEWVQRYNLPESFFNPGG